MILDNGILDLFYSQKNAPDHMFLTITDLIVKMRNSPENLHLVNTLNLSECFIFDKDCPQIKELISLFPNIETLVLRVCRLRNVNIEWLKEILSRVKFLDICYTPFSYRLRFLEGLTNEELQKLIFIPSIDRLWTLPVFFSKKRFPTIEKNEILETHKIFYEKGVTKEISPSKILDS